MALKLVEGFKGSRKVKRAVNKLKNRLRALVPEEMGQQLPEEEVDCPKWLDPNRVFSLLTRPSPLLNRWLGHHQGASFSGGDSSDVFREIDCGVVKIFSTEKAFAALKAGWECRDLGDSVTGTHPLYRQPWRGGERRCFHREGICALKEDGSVVTWGDRLYGGETAFIRMFRVGGNEDWEAEPLPVSLLDGSKEG